MNKKFKLKILIALTILLKFSFAIEVAITVDDLPVHGDISKNTNRLHIARTMLATFKKHHITGVYGFINGSNATNSDTQKILALWVDSGQLLGNHTYSHMNINDNTQNQFIEDIKKNEPILSKFMNNKDYRYFRYPYLREGDTQNKRDAVRKFLLDNHYQIAEVTLDFWDYQWNAPYARCLNQQNQKAITDLKRTYLEASTGAIEAAQSLSQLLFKRDIKHILLLHIGELDAVMLDQVLTNYEKLGVKFISLQDALRDKVYRINSGTIRSTGYTFLNEIRVARKLPNPEVVTKFYDSIPENKLTNICTVTSNN